MLYLHWISGNHDIQSFELFSWGFAVIIISTQWFPFSTHPYTQELLAFQLTNLHSPGHASIVSAIRLFTNSLSLSECKMSGRPNTLNTRSLNPWTTFFSCFDFIGKRIWNFVKHSITWHMQLNSPSGVLRKSIRSIYKRIRRFPVQAPLGTQPGLGTQSCFDLPVTFGMKL